MDEVRAAGFKDIEFIGAGAFGNVFRGNLKGRKVAIKAISTAIIDQQTDPMSEAKRHQSIHCVNVLKVFKCILSPTKTHILIVSELCDGTLEQLLHARDALTPKQILNYSRQLINGIKAIHAADYIHRDIKPENILHSHGSKTIKIGDLGIASKASFPYRTIVMGNQETRAYMAPEVFSGYYRRRADIYSLGLIIVSMVTRKTLPGGKIGTMYIHLGRPHFVGELALHTYAPDVRDVLLSGWRVDPFLSRLYPVVMAMLSPDANARPRATQLAVWLARTKAHESGCALM